MFGEFNLPDVTVVTLDKPLAGFKITFKIKSLIKNYEEGFRYLKSQGIRFERYEDSPLDVYIVCPIGSDILAIAERFAGRFEEDGLEVSRVILKEEDYKHTVKKIQSFLIL